MKLVSIFVDTVAKEGLYAVRYEKEKQDELERLLDNWSDTNYILSYLIFNEKYLKDDYFQYYYLDDLLDKVLDESEKIVEVLENIEIKDLKDLFKPLLSSEKKFNNYEVQLAKGLIKDKINYPQPILRLYGLRISENTFIITGGAIKLCHYMKNHPDTKYEIEKLQQVKKWLEDNGVKTNDDLIYFYGQQ